MIQINQNYSSVLDFQEKQSIRSSEEKIDRENQERETENNRKLESIAFMIGNHQKSKGRLNKKERTRSKE